MLQEIPQESVDSREKRVLAFWKERSIFELSQKPNEGAETFVFYDGPPFATGLPHYGHLLAGTIKDVVLRYRSMSGYNVPRRLGWDCHGLPVENEIEKSEGLSGAKSIEEYGIAKFNEACRSIVLRYTSEWEETVNRMGRWADFKNCYRTMDKEFMESVWWVFKSLYEKGLIYEGFKVMPYSAKLGTPLSNFEAGENYKDVDDPSLTVKFPITGEEKSFFLAWTTTPWTLISNLALMVHPELTYVTIESNGERYTLAKERLLANFPDEKSYRIVSERLGKELEGMRYTPLFDYFKEQPHAFRVILDSDVGAGDGVGIVHSAPAFGEQDFYACRRYGIDLVMPIDQNCQFTNEIPEYAGKFVKDADKEIARRLKERGLLFRQETCHHRYPFCWRSDTPLIYRAMSTWFVAVEKIKERMLMANEEIRWMPEFLKHGRFGKWLEGARDWAISRNRYWGTPIPLWRAEDGEILVIGSVDELEKLTGKKIDDLHRHFIDDLEIVKEGKRFKRIPEVFDCWFESGSMPYAQNHYPFENRALFEKNFPADFIGEGLDQTRGWFYTLTILSAALFDRPAFKNVIVNGIILAEDGSKMSKRLKNYPEPGLVITKYGADAVRLYLLDSPASKASDLCFSERGVEHVLRQIMIPLWNAYSFFVTYARIANWKPKEDKFTPKSDIDRWILSLVNRLAEEVKSGLDQYDLPLSVKPAVGFIDQLTNWYIRRSRRRFWEEDPTPDREEALQTLYTVLLTLSKVAAPFIPFMTEAMYQNLRTDQMPLSVHLDLFPDAVESLRCAHLEEVMDAVQQAVSLGHALRKEHKVKVRQPLPEVFIVSGDEHILANLKEQQHLILDELNVKEAIFSSHEEEFVKIRAKPNFVSLGKRVGKLMPKLQAAIQSLSQKELKAILSGGKQLIKIEGEEFLLGQEDLLLTREVREGLIAQNLGEITLVLNTQLTEELELEGLAREVVNKVNTMRRELGFDVTDRIILTIEATERLKKSFSTWQDYIAGEVLATEIRFEKNEGAEWDLNGEMTKILVERKEESR